MTLSGGAKEHCEQLIPGLPNEITLDRITPKLPCTVLSSLALVSSAWLHGIRSHQVYNARLRAQSTETFALIKFAPCEIRSCSCAVFHERRFYYELAPFPGFDRGIHRDGKYMSCEGKLYVYGYGQDVHVLDLAGQRHWKQCASMLKAREEFGCAAAPNGKIYVTRGILNQIGV